MIQKEDSHGNRRRARKGVEKFARRKEKRIPYNRERERERKIERVGRRCPRLLDKRRARWAAGGGRRGARRERRKEERKERAAAVADSTRTGVETVGGEGAAVEEGRMDGEG